MVVKIKTNMGQYTMSDLEEIEEIIQNMNPRIRNTIIYSNLAFLTAFLFYNFIQL